MDQASSASQHDSGNSYSDPGKKGRHRWIWAVVLVIFAGLFYWVYHQKGGAQQAQAAEGAGGGGGRNGGGQGGGGGAGGGGGRGARFGGGGAIPVTEATATLGDLPVYFNAIGTVTPVYNDTITAQVTGPIVKVYYTEGQYVKKGDPLIDIDPRPYAATLAQAQGVLQRDQSTLAEAQMDQTRYEDAWKKNAIQRQTLEDQEKQVEIDKGTVANDQGTVQYDQVQLGYCHITSPIDGRVGLRLVDPGNVVTANSTTPLVVVAQMQPTTVIFTLAEDNLPQVLKQMKGKQLEVDAFDRTQQNLLSKGKLLTVDNQIDTVTGTVKLRAEFSNPQGMLFPNQFVNTRLLVNTLKNQLLLPTSAVQHNGDVSFVYLIQNNKAVMRNVTTGSTEGGNTVVAGVNAGDVVANSSFEKLQNGSTVYKARVAPAQAGADQANGNSAP